MHPMLHAQRMKTQPAGACLVNTHTCRPLIGPQVLETNPKEGTVRVRCLNTATLG